MYQLQSNNPAQTKLRLLESAVGKLRRKTIPARASNAMALTAVVWWGLDFMRLPDIASDGVAAFYFTAGTGLRAMPSL